MKRLIKLAFAFLLSCAWIGCTSPELSETTNTLPFYHKPDFTPLWLDPGSDSAASIHRIDSFLFTDQSGKTITKEVVGGKMYLANFFFTSCGSICPKMMKNLKKVQQVYPVLSILSHSVCPWNDSTERLKWYADKFHIGGNNWHLLTGDRAQIYSLARRSYFAEEAIGFNRDSTEFLHTEHILLIDGKARIRGIYNGTLELEAERMISDIGLLKIEMEKEKRD